MTTISAFSDLLPDEQRLATEVCSAARETYLAVPKAPPLGDVLVLVQNNNEDFLILILDATGPGFEEAIALLPIRPETKDALLRAREIECAGLLRVVAALALLPERLVVACFRTSLRSGEMPS